MSINLLPERIRSKIAIQPNGCWYWTAKSTQDGYGQIRWGPLNHASVYVHRLTRHLLRGDVPIKWTPDTELDHAPYCGTRHCVHPYHTEVGSYKRNIMSGHSRSAHALRTNFCIHGHEFTAENTKVKADGARRCRACDKERDRAYYLLKKEKV